MDIKHNKLSQTNLTDLIKAGTTARTMDEQKNSEDHNGLPVGHPVRVMMEEAKKSFEDKEEVDKNKEDIIKETKIRKAKKAKKASKSKAEEKRIKLAEEKRDKVSKVINSNIDRIAAELADLGRIVDNESSAVGDFARTKVKMTRLKRFLMASCRGIQECKLDVKSSENMNNQRRL